MWRYVILTLAIFSAPNSVWGDTNAQEVEEDCSLASSLITPHKPWGRGHIGGSIRTLFFIYTGPYDGTWEDTGTRVREAVELCQRFDLDAEAVLVCGRGDGPWTFHGVSLGEARAERLLEKPYDLYCLGGVAMEKLPAKIQYLIIKQVARGAGLLCCGPGASEYMVDRRRILPTPTALTAGLPVLDDKKPYDIVSAYNLGKGRGVWLNYAAHALTPYKPFSPRSLAEYDYWMLLVGRAALWAASRQGHVAVESVLGEQAAVIRRDQMPLSAQVILSNSGAKPLEATVSFELCRADDGNRKDLGQAKVTLAAQGSTPVFVQLPRVRTGDYFLDAVVRSSDGIEAFGAGLFTVESDAGVGGIALDRTFVEVGDTIYGTVRLRGTPPANSVLQLRFRDSYDRVLQQREMVLGPGQTELALEYRADQFATNWMRAEAALVVAGEEVEVKQASFSVPKRRQGRHNFVMWDAPMDVLGVYAWRQLQEAGMSACLIGSMGAEPRPLPPSLYACDASLVPYATRILDEKDEQGFMKPCCWNDEQNIMQHVQKIVDGQKNLREQGVFVYSLGDEGVTKGCCVHPACIEAYRRYLADQYGTIENLNASWGTTYGSFTEVDLLDRTDNMEMASIRTCFPRWYDRQAFARWNLSHYVSRYVEAFSRLDPHALTGYEGTGGFGDDYDAILGTNQFYGPYPSIGDDIIRSAFPRDRVRSNWMGYSKTGDALSDAAWRMVMKGMDSIWFWMWCGIGDWRGYLRPTLDYWPATADLMQEMKPVRQGLGDLLLRSDMTHSGIAIFYSLPSALSCQLENGNQFVSAQSTHETWALLTYELGLDFRYLTSGMLKRGALDPNEFKVLLLPMTQAVSPEEADIIRRFVEAGGMVIADVRPGIYDGHCKPLMPGALDDLFGIRRTGRGTPADEAVSINASLAGHNLNVRLPKVRVDKEVQPTAATAFSRVSETPVLLINQVGAGSAVLLNFQFVLGPSHDEAAAARKVLAFLYDLAGAKAAVQVTSPTGEPLPRTETRIWRTGAGLVFGIWRHMENVWFGPKTATTAGPPVPVRITLPEAQYVYDLRGQRSLGRVREVETKLRWGRASFYLALPYPVPEPRIALSTPNPKPGEVVEASVSLAIPAHARERFAVWVEVADPQGNRPQWGREVVILEQGHGAVAVPTPYNAAPGTWKLRVTELFSNQSVEATWTVSGREAGG